MRQAGAPLLLVGALIAAVASSSRAATTTDLSNDKWTVTNANGSIHMAATVPGHVLTDMQAAGKIGDPLAGWVACWLCCCTGWLLRAPGLRSMLGVP